MGDLKANSSRRLNEKQRGSAWQDGYATIGVGPSQVDVMKGYIDGKRVFRYYPSTLGKCGCFDRESKNCYQFFLCPGTDRRVK